MPNDERLWLQYFQQQSGGGNLGFTGLPYQRGYGVGSFFKGIFRSILPVAKSALKTVGKQALATGAQIAGDVAGGENFKKAVKKRTRAGVQRLARKTARKMQKGRGLGVRKTKRGRKTRIRKTIKGAVKRRKLVKRRKQKRKVTRKRKTVKRRKLDFLGIL